MKLGRIVFGIILAAAVCLSAVAVISPAHAVPPSPGGQCIPCSPHKPCENPLTICTYNSSSNHGCCLGYAGEK